MTRLGRNDPCRCGSGKKYKNCCLAADALVTAPRQVDQRANLERVSGLIEQGLRHQREGRPDEAARFYQQVLEINPGDPDALHLLGVIARDAGKFDDAVALIRRAIAVLPTEAAFHNNLGMAYRKSGQLELALASYEQALKLDPRHVEALNNLGTVLLALGRIGPAVTRLERAIALHPEFAEALFNLGNALQARGESRQALDSYQRALAIRPDFVDALCNCGICFFSIGDVDQAIRCFEQVIARQPDHQPAYMNVGLIGLVRGQSEQALPFLRHANALLPDHPDTLNYLAHAEKNLGLFKEAIDHSWQAFQQAPAATAGLESAIRLALIACLQDDRPLAAEWHQRASAIRDQGDSPARTYWNYLGQLLSWWKTHPASGERPDRVLHAVGDSHVLSVLGARLDYGGVAHHGQSLWIEGCKQWHLGNDQGNSYKTQFERFLTGLPAGSPVLICVGEIDCRQDDGIFRSWKKHPDKSLEAMVESTVGDFIHYLAGLRKSLGLAITVAGVPASLMVSVTLPDDDAARYLSMLRLFNDSLKVRAARAGMGFLDLYALTDAGDGRSNERWHLDRIHLQPAAYEAAFARHLQVPAVSR